MIWPTIAGSKKKKSKKMHQKCWQPIETLWQMQQNVCCVQDNDDISSVPACWSEYRIVSACSQALPNSWAHQETASACACMIVGTCLWWYSMVYQIKKNFSCYLFDCLALFYLFCLFDVFCAVVPVISTALHSLALVCLHLLQGTLFPWGKIKDLKVNNKF